MNEEELKKALQKDFVNLYHRNYTANHKTKQMLIKIEIGIMDLENTEKLISDALDKRTREIVCDILTNHVPEEGILLWSAHNSIKEKYLGARE